MEKLRVSLFAQQLGTKYQISNIKYQISNIKYQISNIKYQISNIKYQISDKRIANIISQY
ncbi:TPA: hypothetical protein ACPKA7_000100 [Haemophilus influenzae]